MRNENMVTQEQAKRIENWNLVRDELLNALKHLYFIDAPDGQVSNFTFYVHDLYESMYKALQVAKAVQVLTPEQLKL